MGLSVLRIADPQRRDRLLLLNAFAIVLLTLLGAAGESLGMDRHLKVNTAKHRTHSLFRQGCMLYELIPAATAFNNSQDAPRGLALSRSSQCPTRPASVTILNNCYIIQRI